MRPAGRAGAAVLSGLLAAATVLGVGHLVAAFVAPQASPYFALGAEVVDLTPHQLKDIAIRYFGSHDKQALFAAMAVTMIAGAAVVGLAERRRRFAGVALLAVLGVIAGAAAVQRPTADVGYVVPTAVGVLAGGLVLHVLAAATTQPMLDTGTISRRRFLSLAAGAAALAVTAAGAGRLLAEKLRDVAADRARFAVPIPDRPVPEAGSAALPIDGITEFVTPADRFYRVDTALQVPAVLSDGWQLRIHGMVDRETVYDLDRLRQRRAVSAMITLCCVSNEVGGTLAGNAVWTGYPLADLIAAAGPHPDADLVLSTSADGFTAGTPLAALTDGRDALLAVAMNGQPLPIEHGYPARMIVPGLYGYVSATKWVIDLEITRFDRARAYWTERGWADRAPIKTASRIDVPAAFAKLPAGPVTVAGVAWAQHRGIGSVEVQIDENPWQQATLATEYSPDTWRQWHLEWDAAPGAHTVRVRSTDSTGTTQTPDRTPPFPSGATGWHSRVVTIG